MRSSSQLSLCRRTAFLTVILTQLIIVWAEAGEGRLPVSALTNLEMGMSFAALERLAGTPGLHQFTARVGTNDLLCIRLYFQDPQ